MIAEKAFLLAAISLLITIFLNIGLISFVATKKLTELESYFPRSPMVANYRMMWGDSLFGRIYRLGSIFSSFYVTDFLARKKQIVAEEPRSVPKRLRMWVTIPYIIVFFQVTMGGVLWLVMEFIFKR